jgi:O-succinylbenzoate synthase
MLEGGGAAQAGANETMDLRWRPFAFPLPAPLRTAAGALAERRGWLLRLETELGAVGWGEATPLVVGDGLEGALERCARALEPLRAPLTRHDLEGRLPQLPPPVAFALGAALAEADGLVGEAAGGWRPAPPSAWLLPAGAEALSAARSLLAARPADPTPPDRARPPIPLTVKWKVGVHEEEEERRWHGQLATLLPPNARLRLDANGGFSRATAWRWADHLRGDTRLEWLEQPLDPADQEGLEALSRRLPVALDESLSREPGLRHRWTGWQVRRPSQEGDPRPLLRALEEGRPRWMVSTSFETGIGQRWLAHLSALQAEGPTPVAPGLAPGWRAPGDLGAQAPEAVWRAAGVTGGSRSD